jgi:thiamine pyrophosphate-dependent acetolactate synthase large subunit-like protein
VKRYDCLQLLAARMDPHMLTATGLSHNSNMWRALWQQGPSFYSLNLGLCLPFALGLALAFPRRKVVALDSDGSLMVDPSALIAVADAAPSNLVAFVFDNQGYALMGDTATARVTDLEQMARGAGIRHTATVRTMDEFERITREALTADGPWFVVAKVEREDERFRNPYPRLSERAMKEGFVQALWRHPDYPDPPAGAHAEPPVLET